MTVEVKTITEGGGVHYEAVDPDRPDVVGKGDTPAEALDAYAKAKGADVVNEVPDAEPKREPEREPAAEPKPEPAPEPEHELQHEQPTPKRSRSRSK